MAIFFGVLPDLVSFVPIFLYVMIYRSNFMDIAFSSNPFAVYASQSYNYTHSFVFFGLAFFIVGLVRKYMHKSFVYWPLFGWALHIFIDIFTHRGFYETPFLFPIFSYKFGHGISWAHPVFMIINYFTLALVYIIWFFVLRKRELNRA